MARNYYFRKYGLAVKCLLYTGIVIGIKIALHYIGIEFLENSSYFASAVSGGYFLLALIVSNTISDYKEADKFPSDIVTSLQNLLEEGDWLERSKPAFNAHNHRKRLLAILEGFLEDIKNPSEDHRAVNAIDEISTTCLEFEKVSGVTQRLKIEQGVLNKIVFRASHIKTTSFILGAYAISEIITALVIFYVLFLKVDSLVVPCIANGILIYIYIYLSLFTRDLDDPLEEGGYADIDMFLLKEWRAKIKSRIAEVENAAVDVDKSNAVVATPIAVTPKA